MGKSLKGKVAEVPQFVHIRAEAERRLHGSLQFITGNGGAAQSSALW